MNSMIRSLMIGLIFWFGFYVEASFAYTTDRNATVPPNYYTFLPPPAGGTYTDPAFGTAVQRLTNALATPNLDGGGNLIFITDEYSSMSPFNQDDSKLLLIHQSYFAVYDGSGHLLKTLPFEINALSEPRWSRSDPNVLYYHSGNQLKQYNVSSDARSVVHTFSQYSSISGKGESDISFDGSHFVLAGDNRYVFVYELGSDTTGPAFDTGGRGFDSIYITPNNNVTITWLQSGTSRFTGIEMFDRSMNFQRQLAHTGGHMDVTVDSGEEVLVWTNSNDASPLPGCDNGIVKIRLSDGKQTCLLSLDWSLAVHISGPANSGWVFIETYAPGDPAPGSAGWVPYANEVVQIKLDGTEARRLLHHRSRPFNSYNYQPHVSVSHDGSRLLYSSNYGLQAILGYASDYSDVYLAVLSGSTSSPSPAPPPPPPAPSTSPSVTTSSLPGGTQNTAYNATVTATGGATPYIWSLASGSLPAGLTLGSSTGVISGTPTQAATSSFTVQVLDTSSLMATQALSLIVNAPAPPPPSTASTTTARIEQNGAGVSLTGTWYNNALSGHSGSSAVLSMEASSRVTFIFTGTAVRWVGYRDEWSGVANVYLDDQFKAAVNTAASPSQFQATLFSVGGLAAGTHKLVVEATGAVGPGSAGAWVWVDAFDVDTTTSTTTTSTPTPAPSTSTTGSTTTGASAATVTLAEQNNAAVRYTGNWFANSLPAHSGGTAALAVDKGAEASFTFTGTGASWIAYRDAWSGIAKVFVDGNMAGRIDTYSPTDSAQSVAYSITGLTPGTHTLTIKVCGQQDQSSGGAWVWVDAFKVTP